MSSEGSARGGYTTASMEVYDSRKSPFSGGDSRAGLVLLYAPGFRDLQPAYPFVGDSVLIGREAPADVLVPQPAVSRSHARFTRDRQGWSITDLGARNGTLVGGAFIDNCRLVHNDEIRVGDAFFKFVDRGVDAFLPYRIDGAVFGAYPTPHGIVGGHQLAAIAADLERIAKSAITVIVLGESGTGKEVFARQIHGWSGRAGAFCAINCAAIPPNLLESELFGYRRGAFSGADRDHVGLVRAADQGTLFLDEVGDMPLEAQAKLLRVLQTKEVLPLGATIPEQVDVRVVCATHRDLSAMQTSGSFRGDLFARLNEYSVLLPPLRHRKEDIYSLCLEFLRMHRRPDLELTVPYMTGLLHYDFPYNVRELEALIKRGIALVEGAELGAAHLSAEIHRKMRDYGRRRQQVAPASNQPHSAPPISHEPPWSEPTPLGAAMPAPSWLPPPVHYDGPPSITAASSSAAASSHAGEHLGHPPGAEADSLDPPSEHELRQMLARCGGNVAAVGRHYGKERMQIHRWMKRYNIDPNFYRS